MLLVSNCTEDRSFIKMKLIKNRLCLSTCSDQLSHLESDNPGEINFDPGEDPLTFATAINLKCKSKCFYLVGGDSLWWGGPCRSCLNYWLPSSVIVSLTENLRAYNCKMLSEQKWPPTYLNHSSLFISASWLHIQFSFCTWLFHRLKWCLVSCFQQSMLRKWT